LGQQVRIEIHGRDEFWSRAFHVEWEHQFPERKLVRAGRDLFLVDAEWAGDLERVAARTFCRLLRAPENPRRRQWLSSLITRRDRD
jgi:hypothetical protein